MSQDTKRPPVCIDDLEFWTDLTCNNLPSSACLCVLQKRLDSFHFKVYLSKLISQGLVCLCLSTGPTLRSNKEGQWTEWENSNFNKCNFQFCFKCKLVEIETFQLHAVHVMWFYLLGWILTLKKYFDKNTFWSNSFNLFWNHAIFSWSEEFLKI